jgi:anaerobic selenocysteine-containing dehydrogenase
MHVARREGLLDEKYIAEHTLGFDQIIPEIEKATPEWAASVTGVSAEKIEEAGALFGRGPSMMWLGQGLQRQTRGGNIFRAALTLAAVTGNFGKPGAGIYYLNGAHTKGVDLGPVLAPELCGPYHPDPISHSDMAEYLEDPARSRALMTWNNNILASSPSQARLRAALKRDDLLTVVVDIFETDTAAHADYVLPAASFLECDDIVSPYFNNYTISAQARAMEPIGESLSNQEIFRRLARAMGYDEPQLQEDDRSVIDHMLGGTPFVGTFDDLKKIGTAVLYDEPRNMFADGKFATPSGKIEIACDALAALGHSLVPEPHADAPPGEDKIRVLSPASEWLVNSSYGNDDEILKRLGEPKALLNPDEASRRGLEDGADIVLENNAGSLPLKVELSDDVPEGVALVHKSRWPGNSPGGVNVNVLYDGAKSDFGDSTAVHSVEARIIAG